MYINRVFCKLFIFSHLFNILNGFIVPKLLLPYYGDTQVNHTIHAESGCYTWVSIRPDIATIEPSDQHWNLEKQCSIAATVTVRSNQPTRKTTLVLATSADSGEVLQCDVIVDKIQTIDIRSRTKELYLEDPPEKLKIRALDTDGNTFSSTAGLKFEWSLTQTPTSDETQQALVSPHSILRIQRYMDAIYIAESYVNSIEKQGKLSDTILVSGIQTGSAVVMASLPSSSPMAEHVKPAFVQLVVKDKVMLIPGQDVYLLVYSTLLYRVEKWRKGKGTQIKLPCQQYKLKTEDKDAGKDNPIVHLDTDTSVLTALNNGLSEIILLDMHLGQHHEQMMEQAKADIFVVEPSYLVFQIEPNGKWILQLGNVYTISVHIFDKENNEIWPSDNVEIKAEFPIDYFTAIESTSNGTLTVVKTDKVGSVEIVATLTGVYKIGPALSQAGLFTKGSTDEFVALDNPITVTQNVQIFDKIEVIPPLVIFPWQDIMIQYFFQFRAFGGSGNYTWSVDNSDLATISYSGVATLIAGVNENEGPRRVGIEASDLRNNYHRGGATAVVAPPVKMEFAKFEKESEIGTELWMYLSMYAVVDGKMEAIQDCSRLQNIKWEIKDQSIYQMVGKAEAVQNTENNENISAACLQRKLIPLKEGYTGVKVTYQQPEFKKFNISSIKLTASTIITAFYPLISIDPYKLAIVSLDATKLLKFKGGPIPWPTFPGNHVKNAQTNNDTVVLKPKVSGKEHIFVVHCVKLGSTEVTVHVYNKPVKANPIPKKVSYTVTVSCDVPTGVKLVANPLPDLCPMLNLRNVQLVVITEQEFELSVTAYDNSGNQFDNFTTLEHTWFSVPENIAHLKPKTSVIELDENQQGKQRLLETFSAKSTGDFTVNLNIKQYEKMSCLSENCVFEPSIESSIAIQVVKPILVDQTKIILFNNAEKVDQIHISGGSGYFDFIEIEKNKKNVTKISIKDNVVMLKPINIGQSRVKIVDLCIEDETAILDITVSDVESITIESYYLLELGAHSSITISVFDAYKSFLNDLAESHIDLMLVSEPKDIISIGPIQKDNEDFSFYLSKISGMKVGHVTIYATTYQRDGKRVASNKITITVFPPLVLLPHIIHLVHGSTYNMRVEGGPPNDISFEFGSENTDIVTISTTGVLTAMNKGKTKVWVKARTQDGKIYSCKEPSEVYVVILGAIRIHSPVSRFYEEAEVPLRVYGIAEGTNEHVDLSAENTGFIFQWRVLNKAVIELQSVHANSQVFVLDNLTFSMIAVGLTSGQSVVEVSLSSENSQLQMKLQKLTADIQLTVYQPLSISIANEKQWNIKQSYLVAPTAICNFASNLDSKAINVVYDILDSSNGEKENTNCIHINNDERNFISSDVQCETVVKVTSVESFGINQTLAVHVQVQNVAYIIAKARNDFFSINSEKKLNEFPVDSQLLFDIKMYDHSGRRFDCTSASTKYLLNRNDLLQVRLDDNKLTTILSYTGSTVVKLWPSDKERGEDDNAAYHFPIPANFVVDPYKEASLTVGVKHCFVAEIGNEDGSSGSWRTKSSLLFVVQEKTGAILSLAVSKSSIEYFMKAGHTSLPISSKPFYAAFSNLALPKLVTNAQKQYLFPFDMLTDTGESHGNCDGLQGQMNEFSKEVFICNFHLQDKNHFNKIFNINVGYIASINSYACIVTSLDLSDDMAQLMSTSSGELIGSLQVKLNMRDRGSTDHVTIQTKFLPAFFVLKSELKLSLGSNENVLCISACYEVMQNLKVECENNKVKILPSKLENNIQCYDVETSKSVPSSFEIIVSNNLINQVENVKVILDKSLSVTQIGNAKYVDNECNTQDAGFLETHLNTELTYLFTLLAVIISTVVLVFLICIIRSNRDSTRANETFYLPNVPYGRYVDNSQTSQHYSPLGTSPYITKRSPGNTPSPRIKLWSSNYSPSDAHS